MSRRRIKLALVACFGAFFALIVAQTLLNVADAGLPASAYLDDLLFYASVASFVCILGLAFPDMLGFSAEKPLVTAIFALSMLIVARTYVNVYGSSLPEFLVASAAPPSAASVAATVMPAALSSSATRLLATPLALSAHGPGIPVLLSIPAVGIHVRIEEVGTTTSGDMEAPRAPEEAGWYRMGPRPGENGLAIVVGHSGWAHGRAVAFDSLHLVKPGDAMSVTDDAGKVHRYRASAVRTFSYDAPLSTMLAPARDAGLALITCAGDWDREKRIYKERLVVIATAEK